MGSYSSLTLNGFQLTWKYYCPETVSLLFSPDNYFEESERVDFEDDSFEILNNCAGYRTTAKKSLDTLCSYGITLEFIFNYLSDWLEPMESTICEILDISFFENIFECNTEQEYNDLCANFMNEYLSKWSSLLTMESIVSFAEHFKEYYQSHNTSPAGSSVFYVDLFEYSYDGS